MKYYKLYEINGIGIYKDFVLEKKETLKRDKIKEVGINNIEWFIEMDWIEKSIKDYHFLYDEIDSLGIFNTVEEAINFLQLYTLTTDEQIF